jgi:hypothetical protein
MHLDRGTDKNSVLITVVEHYFSRLTAMPELYIYSHSLVIAFFCVGFGYNYFAAFYRASAREIKRLGKCQV